MNDKAIYLGKLYTKDQIIEMYTDLKRRTEAIKLYLDLYFEECECISCGKDFNECGCYYNYAEAYLEEIQRIINKKVGERERE
jgi:hypothetical protein